MCATWHWTEDCELRDAFCVRATAGIPDRCLDRARVEAEILFASKENDGAAAPPILRTLFRGTRRIRAAVFVSSRPDGFAKIRNVPLMSHDRRTAGNESRRGARRRPRRTLLLPKLSAPMA